MDSTDALSRSRCRQRRLNNYEIMPAMLADTFFFILRDSALAVIDFKAYLVVVNFCLQQWKNFLKSDSICQSYAQIEKGPVFLTHSVNRTYQVIIPVYFLSLTWREEAQAWVGHVNRYEVFEPGDSRLRDTGNTARHHRMTILLDSFQRRRLCHARVPRRNCTKYRAN